MAANDADAKAALEHKKKIQEARNKLRKIRSKRFVTNLLIATTVMIFVAVIFSALGFAYVFGFICFGMLPGIAAFLIDRKARRMASKTVIMFNFTALFPYVMQVLNNTDPNNLAQGKLYDFQTWLFVFGGAAFGWGVVYLLPHIVFLYLEVKANFHVRRLTNLQDALVKEWGGSIKK